MEECTYVPLRPFKRISKYNFVDIQDKTETNEIATVKKTTGQKKTRCGKIE